MLRRIWLLGIVLALWGGTPLQGQDDQASLRAKFPVLAKLAIPEDQLPKGVMVPAVPAEIPALAGLQNPGISTQPRHFFVVDAGLKNKLDAGQIQAMFMAMYKGKREAGIVGWAFTSEAAAEEGKRIVERRHAREPERIGVYRAGKTVIWVWRDGSADDQLFERLKQHIQTNVLTAAE